MTRTTSPKAQRSVLLAGLAVFLLLLFARGFAERITEWWWFKEVGFERVFLLKVSAGWSMAIATFVVAMAVIYGNAKIALYGIESSRESVRVLAEGGIQLRERLFARLAEIFALPGSIVLSLMLAAGAAAQWRAIIQFIYRTPFGTSDPVFGRDVAYYIFTLPAIEVVVAHLWGILFVATFLVTIPIRFARGDISFRMGQLQIERKAEVHISALVASLMVMFAVRTWFVGIPSLLFGVHTPLQGASLTDLTIRLPAMRVLSILLVVGALVLVWGARRGRGIRTAAFTIGSYIVLSVALNAVIPNAFQRLAVQPNELAKETTQIMHHIAATRKAWGLDRVERRELTGSQELTARDIENNRVTIDNVRLWDREPLLQTFGQLQSIRTYYDFVGVDDDRYMIDGQIRHVFLAARELNAASLPTRTFVNEHLTFTHGMGLTMAPSNEVTPQGLPVLWVQDLPPTSVAGVPISRPQIYFGELPTSFVLAPSRQREFDYPSAEGDEAMYYTYTGSAGVDVTGFFRRALFAVRFGSLNILLSSDFTPDTKIIFHQNVLERADKALPFLEMDRDPYLVVTDSGHLKWILDAYTRSDRYPYSARLNDGTNYLRNSVKVVIDAYNGDINAYVSDPDDPMIRTLSKIYPDLLLDIEEMSSDLRSHLRYPEALFDAQTALYATFHMTEPETFYHREDQWQIPTAARSGVRSGFIRHIVMRLPGEEGAEYILMRPFTPRQKDNLAAWMVARSDGEHYGKLIAYRFPRQSLVFGPTQVVNRINQDTEVARQVSLWGQGGSEVIRGELLVIPIEASLLYVQPLYLRAQGGKIPELKRIVVAHEGRVVMEETFDAGLRAMFGGERRQTAPQTGGASAAGGAAMPTVDFEALAAQASQHYERARAAQRADDWSTYGAEMQRLGEILNRLRDVRTP